MLSENQWKVLLVITGTLVAAQDRAAHSLAGLYKQRYPLVRYRNVPMFVPRSGYRDRARKSRVLFLDDEERTQQHGRGEIDLTSDKTYDGQIKFDQETDYDFTSPGDGTEVAQTEKDEAKEEPSGNERFYDAPFAHRLRPTPFAQGFLPKYYQGRHNRPYAPNHYGFEPYFPSPGAPFAPAVRNSFYSNPNGWKARSPRVVFPYPQDSGVNSLSFHTNSHGGPGASFNDNVVFRDQNFGLNDVATDDLALQDLGTGSADAFADRDAKQPHRARNVNVKERMDASDRGRYDPQYIPVYRHYKSIKPMFIQTDSTKILPPDLSVNLYEFTNMSKEFGGQSAVLPKFKPISDEQMLRISEILKDFPIKTNTNVDNVPVAPPYLSTNAAKPSRFRKGKMLKNEAIDPITEEVTERIKDSNEIERQDEKKCAQGGTCEFFFYCWMVGGLLDGSCGSLLKGCCHRVAKAGILGVQDTNSIDYTEGNGLSYGPVINDQSKSTVRVPLTELRCGSLARHR